MKFLIEVAYGIIIMFGVIVITIMSPIIIAVILVPNPADNYEGLSTAYLILSFCVAAYVTHRITDKRKIGVDF